jgi:hypothetical protein
MDFIEQWFGVSPDNGDGSLELFWVVAIALAMVAVALHRRIARWLSSDRLRRRRLFSFDPAVEAWGKVPSTDPCGGPSPRGAEVTPASDRLRGLEWAGQSPHRISIHPSCSDGPSARAT